MRRAKDSSRQPEAVARGEGKCKGLALGLAR